MPERARHVERSAALLGRAVHGGQAEAGAFELRKVKAALPAITNLFTHDITKI